MPSTYTLNNGIELIATGEQSGTWGDTTNTNFQLLDTSLDGQVTVTLASTGSSGSPNTLPVSDGAASNGRNRLVIFDDSSDLGGTAFVQLTPSDAEKIIYVRNSLSGSRSILLFQGTYSASNDYEVPAGTTAVVFFNGAGSGAVAANVFNNAHFDNLNIVGDVTIGDDLSLNSDGAIINFGADDDITLTHAADTSLTLGGAGSTTGLIVNNTATDGDPFLAFALSGTQKFTMGVDDGDSDKFKIGTTAIGTDTRLSIDSSGNVEIPDGSLTITRDDNVANLTLVTTDADATVGPFQTFYRNSATAAADDQIGTIFFVGRNSENNADVTYGSIETHINAASAANAGGYMKFRVASHDGETQTGLEIRDGSAEDEIDVTIANGAASLTTVSGDLVVPNGGLAVGQSSLSGGNVLVDLHGSGSGVGSQIAFANDHNTDKFFVGLAGNTTGNAFLYQQKDADIEFYTNNQLQATLDNNGSLGIGCDPDSTVTVDIQRLSATSNNVFLRIKNTTNLEDSGIIIDGNNGGQREYRIGVNTIVNSSDLTFSGGTGYQFKAGSTDVFSGDATEFVVATGVDLITNTAAGTSNFRGGFQAGDSIVASNAGVNNIMIGANAGTAIDSGDSNIAIGTDALLAEDDHANNIAIGYQALKTQDAGRDAYNVAVGYQAGLDTTTGFQNIFIGASAGSQASTADSTVAIGYNAGGGVSANPLTGNENTCVGFSAGKAIEGTTANNTFIGSQAGEGTTTGYENVALGYRAMHGNVQGRHNVAIGVQSLDVTNPSSAASQYNVAVGAYAGLANTTGIENVFIGGLSARNNTTANYNVMIGYAVGYNATTAGNSVFIGNSAAQGVDANKLTGDNNTAIGKSAGFKLQGAAADNTFVGREAGKLVTEGIQNVFVGSTAGDATENASDNVAVGFNALGANVGTQNNVAVGARALRDANDSSGNTYNTAVGSNAGRNQSTGIQNTYVGGSAGIYTLTNNYTTFLGVNAGYGGAGSELTGHFNTALGYEAGFKLITSATKNTFVGTYAGYFNGTSSTANGITTGANNTCVGYASYPSSATVSDEFTLGDSNISNLRCNDTSISSLSDERDKTNIVDVPLGLDFIKKLRPVAFDWDRRDGTKQGAKDFGFIAQELKAAQDATDYADHMRLVHTGTVLVPDSENSNPTENEDGMPIRDVSGTMQECLEADPMKTYPVLVKAVQELSTALDAALARIAVLEG